MLKDKNILIGVSGGIAIYKVLDLISKLKKLDANVDVIMTDSAREFITPLTFQTMAQSKVHFDMFGLVNEMDVEHISLAKKADVVLIAPATGNTIGKIANGIADNLLTTVLMATTAKMLFAPAMNTYMYCNPMVQENMDKLKKLGHEFISPGSGRLACGDVGTGKMADVEDIIYHLNKHFVKKDLRGKKVVITAGPTMEPIDPVRYITNHSSGKMGYSLANQCILRGAQVVLISGPSSLQVPRGVEFVPVRTTNDMLNAVEEYFDDCDVLIKSAAPSDFRPEISSDVKIKKDKDNDALTINFVKNPDIAAYFGRKKKDQIMVGFAAETNNLMEYAKKKLIEKNFDFIVANDVTKEGAGFNTDTNIVTIIDSNENSVEYPIMSKEEVADLILDKIVLNLDKS